MKLLVFLLSAPFVFGTDGTEDFDEQNCLLKTSVGSVKCTTDQLPSGKRVFSYRNIPYAWAERFGCPQPVPSSAIPGTPINKDTSPICYQSNNTLLSSNAVLDEDCLFMHVFAPCAPSEDNLLPVIFYVHGGAFELGSGSLYPSYAVEKGVIVVTFNYRLGILGFLSTGACECSGNAGLKDVYAALRWVHKNIGHFGGDNKKITLYGLSAGAVMVSVISLDPAACGLFNWIILESGSILTPWAYTTPKNAHSNALEVGKKVGCDISDPQKLCSCLKNVPAQVLIESAKGLIGIDDLIKLVVMPFMLTSENPKCGCTILTQNPQDLMLSGSVCAVNIIVGVAQEESCIFRKQLKENELLLVALGLFSYKMAPSCLSSSTNIFCPARINTEIGLRYGILMNADTVQPFITFAQFIYGILAYINFMRKAGCKVYFYEFTYLGPCSISKIVDPEGTRTCHAEQYPYVFPVKIAEQCSLIKSKDNDDRVKDIINHAYASFATTGCPTLPSGPEWLPYAPENAYFYIDMGLYPVGRTNYRQDELKFWKSLFDRCSTCPKEFSPCV